MPRRYRDLRIRTRIFLSIFLIATGLLIVMSLGVYLAFAQQLRTNLDETLRLQADSNLALIDTSSGTPSLTLNGDPGSLRSLAESVLRLYDSNGALRVDASPATGHSLEESAAVQDSLGQDSQVVRTIDLEHDEDYRIIASPIFLNGTVAGVLVSGIELSRVARPLSILKVTLMIAVPVYALALAFAGHRIARSALSPVAAMTAIARGISHGDLKQRIHWVAAKDEIGELAHTLNSMIARLHDGLERERRFTADASHELRTPLAAIEAGIDVTLSQPRDPGEYRHVLGVIREQTQRLHQLSRQLLLLSRLDAAELRKEFGTVEITGFTEAVVESFLAVHADSHIEIACMTSPLEVQGDLELLARALSNLLENAVIHAGPEVHIVVSVGRDEAGRPLIAVQDDGPGISEHLGGQVFDRFRRGGKTAFGGSTGLGLAIVDAIMNVHGGEARLAPPEPTGGACFMLVFPSE